MDIVEQYTKAGFRTFPLVGKEPPYGYKWGETVFDPNAVRADYLGNYAVIIGPRYLVIDVDCRNNKVGKESFKQLTADLGMFSGWEAKTYVVQTGTGGFHIMFRIPEGLHVKKVLKKYRDIEWLSGNAYVVGPESLHPDNNQPYKVIFNSPLNIADCPQVIIDLISKPEIVNIGVKPHKDFIDDDPANVERFIAILESMPEVPIGNQRNSAYIAACRGRDLGLSLKVCISVLGTHYNGVKLIPAIREEEVIECAENAYKYAQNHAGNLNVSAVFNVVEVGTPIKQEALKYDTDRNGKILKTLNNAVNYISVLPQLKDAFRYNTFSGMIETSSAVPWYKERGFRGPNLCDEDITLLKYLLSITIKVEFSVATLFEATIVYASKRHYHPVQNYLNALVWDGVPRIDTWLINYGHAIDTIYTRAIGRKTLCAGVRRAMQPGCKWDYTLLIEGAQGIGKSTACRILGRNWCGDINLDPHQKDTVAMMAGKWIIELSEMTALKWADANALRSFLTRREDTVRLPYARNAKDFPRQSIFIGTVNPEHVGYLTDTTGNRRYWIVKFNGPVDLIGLENDCDQLWAEARQIYEKEELCLRGEAETLQVLETQSRMPEDPMRKNIIRWVRDNQEINDTTVEDVLEYLGVPLKNVSRGDQSRVAQSLTEMGWIKEIRREDGIYSTHYRRPL